MACNKKNQSFLGKAILSLFLGIVLISCAGTGSSVQKKEGALATKQKLPEYASEYWNNGKPKTIMTGILYNDHGIIKVDSGRSEIYFESGKIKELNGWKDKQGITSKQWNENGVLIKDLDFPKSCTEYWDNGKIKQKLEGIIYKDDQDIIRVDSGHSEIYFENGKIKERNDWKDKRPVASKQWNEDGVLIIDMDFQKSCTEYWDNGKIKQKGTGILYRKEDANICSVDSGRSEIYSKSGKLLEQNDWKNKQVVTFKRWNEKGVLIEELDFPKYFKKYWNNGKLQEIGTGLLYRGNQDNIALDSGHSEIYFENGKIQQQADWKNKQAFTSKQWNEKGGLIHELEFPKYYKEYYDNGKTKQEMTDLYWDSPTIVESENGFMKKYYENGQTESLTNYKDKKPILYKEWLENGKLAYEWEIPTSYFKEYNENGTVRLEMKGFTGEKEEAIENGYLTLYFNNGKPQLHEKYKDKKTISKKMWYENGAVKAEGDVSKRFHKEYFQNGKISRDVSGKFHYEDKEAILENATDKRWYENGILGSECIFPKYAKVYSEKGALIRELKGTLYYDDQNKILVQDGYEKNFFESGQIEGHAIYKEKELINNKYWHENGNLKYELDFPKYAKVYSEDGSPVLELEGTLYLDEQEDIKVQDGTKKYYYENGKLAEYEVYKEKRLVSKMEWHTNGNVSISAEAPDRYWEFYDNGKIKIEVTGTIIEENEGFKIKDGVYNEYDPNGKITISSTYKDFEIISEKK